MSGDESLADASTGASEHDLAKLELDELLVQLVAGRTRCWRPREA